MKRKITLLLIIALIIIIAGMVIQNKNKQRIRKTIEAYNQKVNSQYIVVDLSDNLYFLEKQPGYDYQEPETITYQSHITGTKRHAMVFLPADYTDQKQYPVL